MTVCLNFLPRIVQYQKTNQALNQVILVLLMVNCLPGPILCSNIETGVPQWSMLDPLLFLIYINNISDGLTTNTWFFADDISLFSVVDNVNLSGTNLNSDLSKINAWKNDFQP